MASSPSKIPRTYNMRFLWLICLVAAMGGFLFGYDWVVIGGAKAFYEPFFDITASPFWQGFAMSTALIGCIFGAILSGALSDGFGRKRLLILSGLLFTASAIWTAMSTTFLEFNIARFLGGLGIGLASNLSPMYIAEIAPAESRGRFVSVNQLTIVIGILAAQLTNWQIAEQVPTADQLRLLVSTDEQVGDVMGPGLDLMAVREEAIEITDDLGLTAVTKAFPNLSVVAAPKSDEEKKSTDDLDQRVMDAYLLATWNSQRGWRWMFGAETIPAFLFFALMFFVPESPRWLVKNGLNDRAESILARVGGRDYAKAEVADIRKTIDDQEVARVRFGDLLEPGISKIVALGVFLAVLQQWCGINVIFNYAQEVFEAAGYKVSDLMFSIVITGIVNLLFTFIAIFTVDRLGRRPLMMLGAAGLAGIYAVLGAGYFFESRGIHMLILVVSAIACYSMSLAPITWVVISEIFPNRIRGAAMSVAVFSLWIGCTALTFTFPLLNESFGTHNVFWLYGTICVVGFFAICRWLPETKGKSLEDIERELID